ncbi:hypothetical protein BCR34DRAFT_614982 [Clohesyomyces aquaticus]|uniref:Uncharacterized protein n=1 Tax=Clohesyomyces aquaticus TaxID=1231657 RepID=A0A1Y1ZKU8_9PLEO|nr:hypothetical protein BCR34DRAFT_614982 [Clohesyomyces aquaticus]
MLHLLLTILPIFMATINSSPLPGPSRFNCDSLAPRFPSTLTPRTTITHGTCHAHIIERERCSPYELAPGLSAIESWVKVTQLHDGANQPLDLGKDQWEYWYGFYHAEMPTDFNPKAFLNVSVSQNQEPVYFEYNGLEGGKVTWSIDDKSEQDFGAGKTGGWCKVGDWTLGSILSCPSEQRFRDMDCWFNC